MTQKKLLIGIAVVAVALAAYFIARSAGRGGQQRATAGALAPDFSLPLLSGGKLELSAYRGKVVLLDFWATWCDPCREEIPRFVDLQNKYGNEGLQIIGVSMDDDPAPVRAFYQHFNINYPVIMGDAQVGEAYGGVLGLPIAFVIGRDGRISAKHINATDTSVFEKEIVGLLQR